MGVKGLTAFIKSSFPAALSSISFSSANRKKYTHLYVEVNPMLHKLVRRAIGGGGHSLEGKIKKSVKEINHLRVDDGSCVTFVMDGVAPLAKLEEQRKRRLSKGECSLRITAGTTFMLAVEKFLLSLRAGTVNGTLNRGEGELKVFQSLPDCYDSHHLDTVNDGSSNNISNNNASSTSNTSNNTSLCSNNNITKEQKRNKIAIIGTDSDSYLFGLGRMIIDPLSLIDIIKGPWEVDNNVADVVCINKIAQILTAPFPSVSREQVLADFLLIIGCGGNDYLQGMPEFVRNVFWKHYKDNGPFALWDLTNDCCNLEEFKRYITTMMVASNAQYRQSNKEKAPGRGYQNIAMWFYGLTSSQRQILKPSKYPLLNAMFNKNCHVEIDDFISMDPLLIEKEISVFLKEEGSTIKRNITPGLMSLIILPPTKESKNIISPVLGDIFRKYHHLQFLPSSFNASLCIDENLINRMQRDIDFLNLEKGSLDYQRVYGND